ncbi:MAG TPA: immunoglobulin domain-containing protein [Candidatus Kapabacteria bacterium]|nr:immunoglobulin domain-containing protein [Candidatus Kapabacteria bacterium]
MFKKTLSFLFVFLLISGSSLFAQPTYPTPFDLSSGDYSLTEWAATNAAGTYPPNMIFHNATVPSTGTDPDLAYEMTGNYTGAYNLTSGTRINGKGTAGFSFVNTSVTVKLGAAVLALNTTNRNTIRVSWKGAVLATNARIYGIRLQYRIGDGVFKDVMDENGNPVEYLSTTPLNEIVSFNNILLPEEVENQPVVYLRWKYYYVSGSGGRPEMSVDDIFVTSHSSIGTPTKLLVQKVTPNVPSSNFPFSVRVVTTDDNNIPKFVTNNTDVSLQAVTNLVIPEQTKTITAGTYAVEFTNLRYLDTNSITLTFTSTGLASASVNVSFVEGPAGLAIDNFVGKTHKNFPLATFTVRAIKANGETFVDYNGPTVTITASGTGNITGTTSKAFFNGVATFDDISFDAAGNYTLTITSPGFLEPIVENVAVADDITFTEIIIPDYIKGVGTLGTDPYGPRMPAFALVQVDNLLPNTTYRYLTGATNDPNYDIVPANNNGAGNNIHFNADAGTYIYNSLRSFVDNEAYSYFTTGPNETSRKIWINIVPTGNAAFNNQNNVYWLFGMAFEDGRFLKRFKSTKTSQSRDFGSEQSLVTGIYDPTSWLEPNSFVVLYDENDAPVSVGIVQSIGARIKTPDYPPQTPWWFADYEETNSAWATYIPNNLANGVRKLKNFDWMGNELRTWTDDDGVWATVDTRNANGGRLNPILFGTPQLDLIMPYDNEELCNHETYHIIWNSNGVDKLNIQVSEDGGVNYTTVFANVDARKGHFEWNIPRGTYSEKQLAFRLISVEHPYIFDVSNNNYIWDTPLQSGGSPSTALCEGENYTLSVDVSGSDLKYQWMKDGKAIKGATSSTLALNSVKYETSGTYTCLVVGKPVCPELITEPIEIYVVTPATVTTQPVSQYTLKGGEVTLYAEAHIIGPNGTRPAKDVEIQWYRGNTPLVDDGKHIAGARSNMLRLSNVQPTMESDEYYVTFTGKCPNTAVSSKKVYVRIADVLFTEQPVDIQACTDNEVTFKAKAETALPATISYQWYFENTPLVDNSRISGANTEELTITDVNLNDAGKYRLMATVEGYGVKLWSNSATLDVATVPEITVQPADNVIVKQGEELEIEVVAKSSLPLQYQWYKDDSPIAGATSNIYIKDDANSSDMGEYYCIIKNDCGEVKSNIAYVTVTRKIYASVDDVVLRGFGVMPVTPNPVNGTTEIRFVGNSAENRRLTITDALGNEVANLFEGNATGSLQNVQFNAANLPAGFYFVTLKSARGIATERMVVVK